MVKPGRTGIPEIDDMIDESDAKRVRVNAMVAAWRAESIVVTIKVCARDVERRRRPIKRGWLVSLGNLTRARNQGGPAAIAQARRGCDKLLDHSNKFEHLLSFRRQQLTALKRRMREAWMFDEAIHNALRTGTIAPVSHRWS